MAATIHAQHSSMLNKSRTPKGMTRTSLTDKQREFIDNYAMQIFADCVNCGKTFQTAIAAVYLSGLQNGTAISETRHD